MLDVVFDIDGTLANAEHRLHFIKDTAYFVGDPLKPNWDAFLSTEQMMSDAPIPQTWAIMEGLISEGARIIFITGRPERERASTWEWLTEEDCECRHYPSRYLIANTSNRLYMRSDGDRRPSSVTKEECLMRARKDGLNPTLVFEDRKDDTEMWRRNGLLCCQVAEGNY